LSWKLAMGTGKGTSGMDEFGSVIDMMSEHEAWKQVS
jgi:hypothetical protein